jgi:hypothetical protein
MKSKLMTFIWSVFCINRIKMLNINIKLEEPLKILKTISNSFLGLDLFNFAKEVP